MDDRIDNPQPKKRRRRGGSLIERAGSVYDFEAVLRARVVMPDQGPAPGQVIDIPLTPVVNPAAPEPLPYESSFAAAGVTTISAPTPEPVPVPAPPRLRRRR